MSQSAELATSATSHPFEVIHYRMDSKGSVPQRYSGNVCVEIVTGIRALSAAEKHGLPITDVTGTHAVPWLTNTVIQTGEGNLYVQDELSYLLNLDPNVTPEARLPQASQLIIAVHRLHPENVQLPVVENYNPKTYASSPEPGAPYAYRPKPHRSSLLNRATPAQWTMGLGSLAFLVIAGTVIVHENDQSKFSRTTECTEMPMSSHLAMIVSRPLEGLNLTVDRQGRVYVSTQEFANAKQATQPIGRVMGDAINGYKYSPDIPDREESALSVCSEKLRPNFHLR